MRFRTDVGDDATPTAETEPAAEPSPHPPSPFYPSSEGVAGDDHVEMNTEDVAAEMAAVADMPTTVHISGGFGFIYMLIFASITPGLTAAST